MTVCPRHHQHWCHTTSVIVPVAVHGGAFTDPHAEAVKTAKSAWAGPSAALQHVHPEIVGGATIIGQRCPSMLCRTSCATSLIASLMLYVDRSALIRDAQSMLRAHSCHSSRAEPMWRATTRAPGCALCRRTLKVPPSCEDCTDTVHPCTAAHAMQHPIQPGKRGKATGAP